MKRIALLLPMILLFPHSAIAGKIFGNLKEGGRSVGQGWEVRITCPGSSPYATATDEFGAYNINVPKNRCELSVKYSDNQWTEPVVIVSSDDPARYDFDLVKENGRYVLKREVVVSNEPKDRWDKADIVLKPVGGLLTALAVAWIGYSLNSHQSDDTSVRLYAELMGRREEADTSLRKDMFNSAIKTFVDSNPVTLEKEVLDLELLAYNFHESIDLGPIFKDVYRRILTPGTSEKDKEKYQARLERLAKEVVDRQIPALEAEGKLDADVYFDEVKAEGQMVINGSLPEQQPEGVERDSVAPQRDFRLTVLRVDAAKREMRVELEVRTPQQGNAREPRKRDADYVHSVFWVGFSDFPMIDNIRLPDGYRCAIVMRSFDELGSKITLVYFPTSRAALKDKPYYDEVMDDLLRARKRVARHNSR